MDAKTWMEVLDKYGWPTLILIAFSFIAWQVFKKYLWPLILEQRAQSAKQLDEIRQAREVERKDFLAALREITSENKQAVTRIAESFDGLREEVRRSRG